MIAGPSLGGFYLAAYYAVGATVQEPEPEPQAEQHRAGGPSFTTWSTPSAPRFRGQRQRVVDGQFLDDDAVIEEVGAPKRADDPPFEVPKPWTPDADAEDDEPAEQASGQQGLGITAPKRSLPPPVPQMPKRIRVTPPNDDDALAFLLLVIGATWT